MAYATVDDVKAVDGQKDAQFDGVILMLLDAATYAINGYCNVPDGFDAIGVATPRLYLSNGGTYLRIDECVEVTAVEHLPADSWVTLTSNLWRPFSGDDKRPDYNRLPWSGLWLGDRVGRLTDERLPDVRVTARWGVSEDVPPSVVSACVVQASRWFKRGQSKWADTVASDNFGQLQFRQALDPDVRMMLEMARLVRPAIG